MTGPKYAQLLLSVVTTLFLSLFLSACGGGSVGAKTPPAPPPVAGVVKEWTWMGGSSFTQVSPPPSGLLGSAGVYGTLGVSGVGNVPGGRSGSAHWTDTSGNFWLFGGDGLDSTDSEGLLNDLWKFDPTANEWAWMGGSNTANPPGVYGTLGVSGVGNVPRGRLKPASWVDRNGNLWLFGGIVSNEALNDLWEFDPTAKTWTWMSGSNTPNASGVYGTLGVGASGNVPGARWSATGWTDSEGNLWLFGGAVPGQSGILFNDLWEFSPTTNTWTWMSGSNSPNALGVYGALGVAAPTNVPGSRYGSASWVDSSGNLWLFGGDGNGTDLNDLWKFIPATKTWTWMSGSNTPNGSGVYGTLGVAGMGNVPGARTSAVSWTDSGGNFWLLGGTINALGEFQGAVLADFWQFNPLTNLWTWMSGSSGFDSAGVYGTLGQPSASNVPGSRSDAMGWTDSSGDLWLFGGFYGYDGNSVSSFLSVDFNDLWRYQP
jgi:N-acetylneuraminic acid mutarotase